MLSLFDFYKANGFLEQCDVPHDVLKGYKFPEDADFPTSDWHVRSAVWKVFNGTCPFTGKKISRRNYSIDHVFPASKARPLVDHGLSNVYNYCPTTQRFNCSKGASVDVNTLPYFLYRNRGKFDRVLSLVRQMKVGWLEADKVKRLRVGGTVEMSGDADHMIIFPKAA